MTRIIRIFGGVVIGICTFYGCCILYYASLGTYGVSPPKDQKSFKHARHETLQEHYLADNNVGAAENGQDGASPYTVGGRQGTSTISTEQPAATQKHRHSNGNNGNRLQVKLHSGFELARTVQKLCSSQHLKIAGSMKKIFLSSEKSILYCPVEKIASTFWKRSLVLLPELDQDYLDPYDVPTGKALKIFGWMSDFIPGDAVPDDSFRFIFVRNPYSRLFSAFVDKFVAPNPTFWKNIGTKAILMFRNESRIRKLSNGIDVNGSDMTFSELVKYVTVSENTGRNYDSHFSSIFKSCKPCWYNYTYVGRLESFHKDAITVLEKLRINTTVLRFKHDFREMWAEDAIEESIRTAFSWKEEIVLYITWKEALERIWLKFQMRGIIGYGQKLDLSDAEIYGLTERDFLKMARKARGISQMSDISGQKRTALREAFSAVLQGDIDAFKEAYHLDFMLFDYADAVF